MIFSSTSDQAGQSTLEFTLVLTLLLGMIFFFIQLSLVFSFGNYAHYATFMAARAYQAAGFDPEDQKTRAKNVLIRSLKKSEGQAGADRYPGLATAVGGGADVGGAEIGQDAKFVLDNKDFSWLEGVRYTFRSRLFLIPLGRSTSSRSLTLTSESWLSREPTYVECVEYLEGRFGAANIDNGC